MFHAGKAAGENHAKSVPTEKGMCISQETYHKGG